MRELSRRTKLAQTSVINHLKELLKEQLIMKEKKGIYPTFKANRDDEMFKAYKKNDLLLKMRQTGLIGFIYDSCLPDAVILFGSASKGEDFEESDIDLYVKAREKKLNLQKYEKLLNRKITLFFKENFSELGNELKNNIINGIIIMGYLKVF